jgi:hypothetical protein
VLHQEPGRANELAALLGSHVAVPSTAIPTGSVTEVAALDDMHAAVTGIPRRLTAPTWPRWLVLNGWFGGGFWTAR